MKPKVCYYKKAFFNKKLDIFARLRPLNDPNMGDNYQMWCIWSQYTVYIIIIIKLIQLQNYESKS